MSGNKVKAIYLEQDKECLENKYRDILSKKELDFLLNHLVDSIKVGDLYDFYVVNENAEMIDNVNLHVSGIEPILENNNIDFFDYVICGTDEYDNRIEVNLSQTKFWTS
ncbi:hypothetical protein [uncultured Tissierella sp.]|uniref:hypothetical protein n=1 Tax=uncultured Tissierella sp. TaxID=448160 RepID=UPI00280610B4|nr:hypothetical protein [uncultured Tissierella sp.]MDU5080276.1 hypothetical protein [Bacillota bacterium]